MCRLYPLFLVSAVFILAAPVAGAVSLTINAVPATPHIGDTILLNGTVSGIKTIAVYLFVTGPDLDPRGVTLDNLNIAAGHGLFTTAPVNMDDGSWSYRWDTSVILGTLKPGNYTVYVVGFPVERLRFAESEYAAVTIFFTPSPSHEEEAPLDLVLPVCAFVIAALVCVTAGLRWR